MTGRKFATFLLVIFAIAAWCITSPRRAEPIFR